MADFDVTLPPENRAVGSGAPAQDHNLTVNALKQILAQAAHKDDLAQRASLVGGKVPDAQLPDRLGQSSLSTTIKAEVDNAVKPMVADPNDAAVRLLLEDESTGAGQAARELIMRRVPPLQGSDAVRGMAFPSKALATAPTFTASTTETKPVFRSPYWSGFRPFGAPLFTNGLGSNSAYPRGPYRTDGTFSVWDGAWGVDFDFDGQAFEFRIQVGTTRFMRLWVDEVPHSIEPVPTTSLVTGLTSGNSYWIGVDFGSRAYRRIRLEFETRPAAQMMFSGVRHGPLDTVVPPSRPSPRIMWITDSYGHGIGAAGEVPWKSATYPTLVSRLLGYQDYWTNLAVPSTGLCKPNAGVPTLGTYRTRFASDVYPFRPDVIVLQGSINDTDNWPTYRGQVGPELLASIAEIRANLPDVKLIVTSPAFGADPTRSTLFSDGQSVLTVRDEMRAAAATAGVPFIDLVSTETPIFTGSGDTGHLAGDGNADRYLSSDRIHLNAAGYAYLARWLAGRIAPLLGQSA